MCFDLSMWTGHIGAHNDEQTDQTVLIGHCGMFRKPNKKEQNMGIFKRLHRITIGRIETFLDKAENPEHLFPVLIEEMQTQLKAATSAEAKATVALKQATRDLEKHLDKV